MRLLRFTTRATISSFLLCGSGFIWKPSAECLCRVAGEGDVSVVFEAASGRLSRNRMPAAVDRRVTGLSLGLRAFIEVSPVSFGLSLRLLAFRSTNLLRFWPFVLLRTSPSSSRFSSRIRFNLSLLFVSFLSKYLTFLGGERFRDEPRSSSDSSDMWFWLLIRGDFSFRKRRPEWISSSFSSSLTPFESDSRCEYMVFFRRSFAGTETDKLIFFGLWPSSKM